MSPEFYQLIEYLKNFPYEEVIFFGGSFDPWHPGHKECLKLCPNNKKVIIIPDHNPQKEKHTFPIHKIFLEHLEQETKDICFGIFDGFMELQGKNPTYFWLNSVHQAYPHLKISLLMGADSFLSLMSWIEFESLIKLISHLYVVPRLIELEKVREMKASLENLNPTLKITLLSSHQYENLSSTELRSVSDKK